MAQRKDPEPSALMKAAVAFDDELRRFARLTDLARRSSLASQKDLERATRGIQEIAESEAALGRQAKALIEALNSARGEQEGQVHALADHLARLEQRNKAFRDLMERYGALGVDATALTQQVQAVAAVPRDGSPEANERLTAPLRALGDGMMAIADRARALSEDARAEGFDDVRRQADSLRQQLVAAKGKLTVLARRLSPGGGAASEGT